MRTKIMGMIRATSRWVVTILEVRLPVDVASGRSRAHGKAIPPRP